MNGAGGSPQSLDAASLYVEGVLVMPKKIDPNVRARGVKSGADNLGEYSSLTVTSLAVVEPASVGRTTARRWVAMPRQQLRHDEPRRVRASPLRGPDKESAVRTIATAADSVGGEPT